MCLGQMTGDHPIGGVAQVITIPGLLQTPEHARAIFREVVPPLMPP
ncbi:hypothetical protein BJY27_005508 [Streptomyces rapamycinicus]|uniref:Uncharacterized protein n=1 Tax=Streptomyces rapamycinicus TaxID=1226757 RepID=A0ABR6LS34_9ACTN|nr:hypothetical protein [Streptomyces rapamycinicus]